MPAVPDVKQYALKASAIFIAGVVATTESFIAVYFMHTFSPLVVVVGVAAFCVNFFLFRSDTYSFLQCLKDNTFGLDKNGKPYQGIKRYILYTAFVLAIFAGLVTGFLQFNALLTVLGVVFYGLNGALVSASMVPTSLYIISGVIASFAALATTALLFKQVDNFIRDFKDYKAIVSSMLSEGSLAQRAAGFTIAVIALFGCGAIYVLSLGVFHAQTLAALNFMLALPKTTVNTIALVVTHIGQILNGFFYMFNIFKLSLLLNFVCKSPDNSNGSSNIEAANNVSQAEVSTKEKALKIACLGVLTSFAVLNAYSQGLGAAHEEKSIAGLWAWLHIWTLNTDKITRGTVENLALVLVSAASFSANFRACKSEIYDPPINTDPSVEVGRTRVALAPA